MNMRQLEILLEVANCKSINKASKYLYMTPQAVSASIISLESELGFQIMTRSRSGVRLTPEGERILHEANQMLENYNSWKNLGKNSSGSEETITIATSSIMNEVTSQALSVFIEDYPKVNVTLFRTSRYLMDDLPNCILDINLDVGIYSVPDASSEAKFNELVQRVGYRTERLFIDEYMVFTNKELNKLEDIDCFEKEDLSKFNIINYYERESSFMYPELLKYMNQDRHITFSDGYSTLRFLPYARGVCSIYPSRQIRRLYEMKNIYGGKIDGYPVRDFPMPTINLLFYRSGYNVSPTHNYFISILRKTIRDWIN